MYKIVLPGLQTSMPNKQTQNISTINNFNLTYQNFHSNLGKSMNNSLYSQEQNINPNTAMVNGVYCKEIIKNNNIISNLNQTNINNIQNSKAKIIEIKKGKLTSSGYLLV